MPNIEINHRTSFHRMRTMSQSSAASLQSGDTGVGSCSPPNTTPNNTPTTSTVNLLGGGSGAAPNIHASQMTTMTTSMQKLQGVTNQSPPGLHGVSSISTVNSLSHMGGNVCCYP